MNHSDYQPVGKTLERIVPTEKQPNGCVLRGVMHDPFARVLKGDLFGASTYGHTGYAGTSIIIDPDNQIAFILIANRIHPADDGNIVRLHSFVVNVVAATLGRKGQLSVYSAITSRF